MASWYSPRALSNDEAVPVAHRTTDTDAVSINSTMEKFGRMLWLGSSLGTLPILWLLFKRRETDQAPRIVDQVVRGNGRTHDIQILSCRRKPDWRPNVTIRYRGEFYQMFK